MSIKKITIEFNDKVKLWEAIVEYHNKDKVTYMETSLPDLSESVLSNVIEPEVFFAK